ncbi:MAG: ParB N-terminal domain-containing protein [Cyanothece sp. SIO2G6]|nr:ParB N-terminal domain-containing protein [Cyanothece sp. SIO2G6]
MGRRKKVNVDDFFAEVDQTSEVHTLRSEVQTLKDQETELRAQIEKLKAEQSNPEDVEQEIQRLREHLLESQGKVKFPISKIKRNENQPRQSFTEEVEAMKLSLQQEGQLQPVILFEDGTLFDGECRWRAAPELDWETLDAVFMAQLDPKELRRKAYLTSLHRKGLNALDKAEALIAIAGDHIEALNPLEVPKIINRVIMRLKRNNSALPSNLQTQPKEVQEKHIRQSLQDSQEIELFLLYLGLQEHPATLNRNVFPALKLSSILKQSVRKQGLGCPQALLLNRLDPEIQRQGIEAVLKGQLSIAQTKKWIKDQNKQEGKPKFSIVEANTITEDDKEQIVREATNLKALNLEAWQNLEVIAKVKQVQRLLQEIKELT